MDSGLVDDGVADGLTGDDPGSTQAEYPGGPEPLDIDSLLADIELSDPGATPVEITHEIFRSFEENFGESESANLQNHWGDKALHNQSLVRGLVSDHQEIEIALDNHLSLDNGLSLQGVQLIGEFIAKRAGYPNIDSMVREHEEIGHIFNESFNESTDHLSATGTLRVLHYCASRSGYTFKGKQP